MGSNDDETSGVGVVTTTCVGGGIATLVWWARYHLALGVERIFVYVHDAEDKVEEVRSTMAALAQRIDVDRALEDGRRDDVDVVAMQERDVADAIKRGRDAGLEWLVHVDDDELVFPTRPGARGAGALRRALDVVKPGTFNLRLDNLEAQKLTHVGSSSYGYFEDECAFKLRVGLHADGSKVDRYHDPRFYVHGGNPATGGDGHTAPYLSYWNGKSAGRLAEPGLRPCGVHFYASSRGDAAKLKAQETSAHLVVLHFPFCHYLTWRHKFNVLDASQRSDWGHYKQARLAIVNALAPGGGGEAAIHQFYRSAVLGAAGRNEDSIFEDTADDDDDDSTTEVALYLPGKAAPQEWRSGIYRRRQREETYELCAKHKDQPASYLYRLADKGCWLVGSTPGATTGACVVYDPAPKPWAIRASWTVYDGEKWIDAPDAGVGRILQLNGSRFSVIDASEIITGAPSTKRRRKVAAASPPSAQTSRRPGPDHAQLASVVLAALETHQAYRRRFWAAVTAAAGREPPGDIADMAFHRALAAGARAMGAPALAASLVAEAVTKSETHGPALRSAIAQANTIRNSLLAKHVDQDVVCLSMPGLDGVQSWRSGLYAKQHQAAGGGGGVLYRRVKECPSDQDSFLYPVPQRGMWLVGSTPGSTTGGIVAYDRATRPRDLKANWHVYDGKRWVQAPQIALKPLAPDDRDDRQPLRSTSNPTPRLAVPAKRAAVAPILP